MAAASPWARDDADAINRALSTEGGHLFVGEAGYVLAYQRGTTLSGYDVVPVKAACIAAGLPVIDSRRLGFEAALHLAVHGPMVAVGKPADAQSWHALAHAPLHHVAALYHAAGAEVVNLPAVTGAGSEGGGTGASRQEAPPALPSQAGMIVAG